jgi:hypothetical protein
MRKIKIKRVATAGTLCFGAILLSSSGTQLSGVAHAQSASGGGTQLRSSTETIQQSHSSAKRRNRRPPRPKVPPKKPVPPLAGNKPLGPGDALPVASSGNRQSGTFAAATGNVLPNNLVPGAAIGGLPGAVWADQNGDGYVDGYLLNGQYFSGVPAGYDPGTHAVLAGTNDSAAWGTAAGAVLPGVSIPSGAVIGDPVNGLAGAFWADRNNDGVVDGYIYQGRYYPGAPYALPMTGGPERG